MEVTDAQSRFMLSHMKENLSTLNDIIFKNLEDAIIVNYGSIQVKLSVHTRKGTFVIHKDECDFIIKAQRLLVTDPVRAIKYLASFSMLEQLFEQCANLAVQEDEGLRLEIEGSNDTVLIEVSKGMEFVVQLCVGEFKSVITSNDVGIKRWDFMSLKVVNDVLKYARTVSIIGKIVKQLEQRRYSFGYVVEKQHSLVEADELSILGRNPKIIIPSLSTELGPIFISFADETIKAQIGTKVKPAQSGRFVLDGNWACINYDLVNFSQFFIDVDSILSNIGLTKICNRF